MRSLISTILFLVFFVPSSFAQSGSITGRVTNGSVPLLGFLNVYKVGEYQDYFKQEVFNVSSNGVYTVSNLPDGSYIVRTLATAEQSGKIYVDEVYDNKPCSGENCDLASGKPVVISGGAAVTGIDFVLESGSQISGQVTEIGKGAINSYVSLYDSTARLLHKQQSGSDGTFIFGQLARGTYYLTTSNTKGFIDELYGDIPCPNDQCNKTLGTPIVISQTDSSTTINFALVRGGKISGTVRSIITNAGLRGVPINIYDHNNVLISTGTTGNGGSYSTEIGLPSGTYYARTNTPAFQNQLYKGLLCTAACNPLLGKPINVTVGKTVKNINFTLDHISNGPSIDLRAHWDAPNRRIHAYTLTISNTGANTSGGFTVKLYRSTEATLAQDAKPFKKYHFSLLIRRSARHYNFDFRPSHTFKYAIAVVDSDDVIPEKNERNNIAKISIK